MRAFLLFFLLLNLVFASCSNKRGHDNNGPRKIEILFLGHASEHHNSALFMPMLASALAKDGINFTYTDTLSAINKENLARFDGLMLYANYDSIDADAEKALMDFVADGKGFLPIHCASFCFQNSDAYINLVGGQFLKHDTATFTAAIVNKEHPSIQGVNEFSTWDETYVHQKLSDDKTVLMERIEGDHHEPWTWVREQGKGRVYYTAYGHDERTWNNPGFHALMKQAITWAVGDKVKSQWEAFRKDLPTLVYKPVDNIPNYEQRDPVPQFQEPLTAEESKKLIQVPVGFELSLFASEPDIINPIAMDWDERGRLWVIETVDYPNSVRDDKGKGDDRIKICEDTDGDGKADKFTVFADHLNIPTSLVFINGGVIISQAPDFIFLKDTDGDDKADVREVIIHGWGTFDTHAGPSNLRYGFDNNLWGSVGYSGFDGKIGGKDYKFAQGLYRFTPDGKAFEFLTSTSNNTWGLGFTERNDVFGSTANNTHSVYMGITNNQAAHVKGIVIGSEKIDGHYAMHPITEKVRQVDVFGGFTAAAGHNFYTARAYPKSYWNNVAFVCEPTGHLVHIMNIEKEGAGFRESDGWNLFAGADEWVAPVEAKVGPDGSVWVLDWYNFIVQHNPTPTPDRGGYTAETGEGNAYVNPLRDKSHGRIWRVVNKDAKDYQPITLDKNNINELVDALGNDNMFWRMTAQRLLVENKNTDALPKLYKRINDDAVDAFGNNYAALHALWTVQGLASIHKGNEAYDVVVKALHHPAAEVRKAAIQILAESDLEEAVVMEAGILNDTDPHTRLAAILALTKVSPSENLGAQLFSLSEDPSIMNDQWLAKAVYAAAVHHTNGFAAAYQKAHPNFKTQTTDNAVLDYKAVDLDVDSWKTMKLPQFIEDAGLDIDGIIWFRKVVNVPNSLVGKKVTLSLGPIDDIDITYINGKQVGTLSDYKAVRKYDIPAGALKAGRNTIAIQVTDNAGGGGLYGKPDEMFIEAGASKLLLSGDWHYSVEKQFSSANLNPFKDNSIGVLFMKNYGAAAKPTAEATVSSEVNAKVVHIKVVKNEMKYDVKTFTVEAGKPVEIVFENPDFMQHNLVIAKQGALKIVGQAADKLAADPKGAEMNYVPKIPEVLFSTPLVNPQQTVKLTFIAPSEAGDYPFECTFPGHWSLMNGMMKVVKKK